MKKFLAYIVLFLTCLTAYSQTLSLDQCKEMAVENNIRLKNSRIDYEIADETRKQAFTAYFPKISAMGFGIKSTDGMVQTDLDLSSLKSFMEAMGITIDIPSSVPISMMDQLGIGAVSAIEPVYAGRQIATGNKLSKIGKQVAEIQLSMTTDEILVTTEQYFWQLVSLEEKIKTIDAAEKLLKEALRNLEEAVNAGVVLKNDYLKIDIKLKELQSARLKLTNGIGVMKLLLGQYIGSEDDKFELVYDDIYIAQDPQCYYLEPEEGASRCHQAQLLDISVEAAGLQHKMAIGKNLPVIGVGAAYAGMNMMDKTYGFGAGMATISIPISDWWGGSHAIRIEKMNIRKAENNRDDNMKLLEINARAKWNSLTEAYQQISIAESTLVSAKENLRLADNCYKAGTILLNDFLDAELILRQAKDNRVDKAIDYRNRTVEYLKATGR